MVITSEGRFSVSNIVRLAHYTESLIPEAPVAPCKLEIYNSTSETRPQLMATYSYVGNSTEVNLSNKIFTPSLRADEWFVNVTNRLCADSAAKLMPVKIIATTPRNQPIGNVVISDVNADNTEYSQIITIVYSEEKNLITGKLVEENSELILDLDLRKGWNNLVTTKYSVNGKQFTRISANDFVTQRLRWVAGTILLPSTN